MVLPLWAMAQFGHVLAHHPPRIPWAEQEDSTGESASFSPKVSESFRQANLRSIIHALLILDTVDVNMPYCVFEEIKS
jgi:hypothetical protein